MQSTGHGLSAQDAISSIAGHAEPPNAAPRLILRTLARVPPPHETVHECQPPHDETTQSTAHGCALHDCQAVSIGHGLPPCSDTATIPRRRVCRPSPQGSVHSVHALNEDTVQSTAHGVSLQLLACVRYGHVLPDGALTTERARVWTPDPHDREQALQAENEDISQWVEQAPKKHGSSPLSDGHTMPPCPECLTMMRVRNRIPVPHVTEHGENALHADTMQSIAHGAAEHARCSVACAHDWPPNAPLCNAPRHRDCTPLPHDALHSVQSAHAIILQSMGHAWVLHSSISAAWGHACPPNCGCTETRWRVRQPLPHERLQAVAPLFQAVQSPTSQSTGHSLVLQLRVSVSGGQGTPCADAGTWTALWRPWIPDAHDCVHALHGPKVDTTQSFGHVCTLQVRSSVAGHSAPPFCAPASSMVGFFCTPVPQVRVQVVQPCS
jgi:hypothetical protein